MEEREKAKESARKVQEAGRKTAGQLASLGTETMGVWSGVTQNVLRDLMDLGSTTAQESARLMAELQQATLESLGEIQHATLRWQASWPEAYSDPMGWYQRWLQESVNGVQRSFGLARRNAESVTRAFERMRETAEDATRTLQETFKDAVSRMQDVQARGEKLRVA